MKKNIFIIYFIFSSISLFAKENTNNLHDSIRDVNYWTNIFDNTFNSKIYFNWSLGKNSAGNKYIGSESFYGLAYGLDALTDMYEATNNIKYIDTALQLANNVISIARPTDSIPNNYSNYPSGYYGWISIKDNADDDSIQKNYEYSLYETYFFRYVSKLLRVIKQDSVLYSNINIKNDYIRILNFTEKNIWEKWFSRSPFHLYWSVTHISAHSAYIATNLYLLTENEIKKNEYYNFLLNINIIGIPGNKSYSKGSFRNQKQHPIIDSNYYSWYHSSWDFTKTTDEYIQDVSHGNNVVSYIIESHDRKLFWNDSDIVGLKLLLKNVVWDSTSNDFNSCMHGNECSLDTTINFKYGRWQTDGWLKLGRYFSDVQSFYEKQIDLLKVLPFYNPCIYAHLAYNARCLIERKFTISNIQTRSFSINWQHISNKQYVVFVKQDDFSCPIPIDGENYVANSTFKMGSQIGLSGWYCVYKGYDNLVNITNLLPYKKYNVMIFECDSNNTFESNSIINQPKQIYTLGVIPQDFEALKAIYRSTNGSMWKHKFNWDTLSNNVSNSILWHGVVLGEDNINGNNADRIVKLILDSNYVSGFIPPEIGNLTELTFLSIKNYTLLDSNHVLNGVIPREIGNLAKLEFLYLDANNLRGNLPKEIGNLHKLKYLILQNNKLSGKIPKEIGNLINLKNLTLARNQFSDEIPKEVYSLKNLEGLNLCTNNFCGKINSDLGMLSNLTYLYLHENLLVDSIPESILNLTKLKTLALGNNNFSFIPNLSSMNLGMSSTISGSFSVYSNKLTFNSLEPNISKFTGITKYSNQAVFELKQYIFTDTIDAKFAAILDLGGSNNRYALYKTNGTLIVNYQSNPIFFNIPNGEYFIKVKNINVPSLVLKSKSFNIILSPKDYVLSSKSSDNINTLIESSLFEIFPNPNSGRFTLKIENEYNGNILLNLKNFDGKIIEKIVLNKTQYIQEFEIYFNSLKGVYIAEVNIGNYVEIIKFIKN